MGTTISVRLDSETERIVGRVARRRKQTKSEVVRAAIAALAKEETPLSGGKPYEAVAHLVGSVRGGPADLSERTGYKFGRLLADRKRRRR